MSNGQINSEHNRRQSSINSGETTSDGNKNRLDEPIPGPSAVGPEYEWEPDRERPLNPILKTARAFVDLVRTPAHWVRENVVEANRGPKYYWYHRKFKRALPIDECYFDDEACAFEANVEFQRNRLVDICVLDLLRNRRDNCHFWNLTKKNIIAPSENCKELVDIYDREEINFFTKYGDIGYNHTVGQAYMKQKHRMIMERRRAILKEQGLLPEAHS